MVVRRYDLPAVTATPFPPSRISPTNSDPSTLLMSHAKILRRSARHLSLDVRCVLSISSSFYIFRFAVYYFLLNERPPI